MMANTGVHECRGDVCYLVSLSPGGLFDLLSSTGDALGKCYEAIGARGGPCPSCPLLSEDPARTRVLEPLKDGEPFRLVNAVLEEPRQARVVVRHVPQEVVSDLTHARIHAKAAEARLSPRECEVLDAMLLGQANDSIAEQLGISPRTVKFHQARLLGKLGAESKLDLLRLFL